MKNKVLFYIIILLSSSSAYSQSFELGVKLGVNNSNQSLRTDEATGIPGSQNKGIITILHLNTCNDLVEANMIMKENNCSEILWVY